MKGYKRFFFHYRKSTGGMTVHWNKVCMSCTDIVCEVSIETKRNKTQPMLVLQGFASKVIRKGNTIYIK